MTDNTSHATPLETGAYLRVTSETLSLRGISDLIGLEATSGWSVGDPWREGTVRQRTLYAFGSHEPGAVLPAGASAQEYVDTLIGAAELIGIAVRKAGDVLRACLEIVETFGPCSTRTFVLDKRWLDALHEMKAAVDCDSYLSREDDEAVDRALVLVDGALLGKTLRYTLTVASRPEIPPVYESAEVFWNEEYQSAKLIEYVRSNPQLTERYALHVHETMQARGYSDTGFVLKEDFLAAMHPYLVEIRVTTTVDERAGMAASSRKSLLDELRVIFAALSAPFPHPGAQSDALQEAWMELVDIERDLAGWVQTVIDQGRVEPRDVAELEKRLLAHPEIIALWPERAGAIAQACAMLQQPRGRLA